MKRSLFLAAAAAIGLSLFAPAPAQACHRCCEPRGYYVERYYERDYYPRYSRYDDYYYRDRYRDDYYYPRYRRRRSSSFSLDIGFSFGRRRW